MRKKQKQKQKEKETNTKMFPSNEIMPRHQ